MSIAVAALKRTVDPRIVVRWIWLCLGDYLRFFLVSMVYHGAVAVAYIAIVWILTEVFTLGGRMDTVTGFSYMFLLFACTFLVFQYAILATYAMLGTMLKRHDWQLDYDADD
jgi:hypothetical protein